MTPEERALLVATTKKLGELLIWKTIDGRNEGIQMIEAAKKLEAEHTSDGVALPVPLRMLTMKELLQAKSTLGVCETEDEAIQRKFCEVNGLAPAGVPGTDRGNG